MAEDPTEEILEATYRALCAHGYADLTLRDIAAESDRSKSSIHYHYDTKEELFAAFLDDLYDRYTARIRGAGGETPRDRLHALLDAVFPSDDATTRGFETALLALTSQAPYDGAIRDRLEAFDAFLFDRFRTVIAAGVDAGEFGDGVDPAVAAAFLTAAVAGGHTRRIAVDRSPARLEASTRRYVETYLCADAVVEA